MATLLIPVQFKRKTAAAWTAANPVLLDGEPGWEDDALRLKIGDGVSDWNSLPYVGGAGGTGTLTGAIDPNGAVSGVVGQLYSQVVGTAVTLWTNVDGSTQWV